MCRFVRPRCRLGEDRLLKRTQRRVRSQGAGVRATQALRALLLTPWGPEDRERRASGPPPGLRAAGAHTDSRPRAWPPPQMCPQSAHVEACENLALPRCLPLCFPDMDVIIDDAKRGLRVSHVPAWSPLERGAAYGKTSLSALSQGIPWVTGGEPPPHPIAIWK